MNQAETKLRKARAQVVLSHPFFGALLLKQELVETDKVRTMATDGKNLYYQPDFILGISAEELQGVCAHEAMHPGLCHHLRQGERDHSLWNQACDYAINPILVQAGFKLPSIALLDSRFADMSAEDIYSKLQSEQPPPNAPDDESDGDEAEGQGGEGDGDTPSRLKQDQLDEDAQDAQDEIDDAEKDESERGGDGGEDDSEKDSQEQSSGASERDEKDDQSDAMSGDQSDPVDDYGGCGAVLPAPFESEPERQAEESEWKVTMTQAANMAKAHGDLPGALARVIDAITNPIADWQELLRRFMDQFAKADYSWETPNRRMIANGLYLPSLKSEQLPPIAFVIDASGSMPNESLEQAAGELQAIVSELKPEFLDVYVHDTEVRHTERFETDEPIELNVKAGGGTRFGPTVDAINEADEEYACVVWFTDLCTGDLHRVEEIDAPIIWLDYGCQGLDPEYGDEYVELHHD